MTKAHAELVGREVCLGKQAPKEDERTLKFATYAHEKKLLPKAPTSTRWSRPLKKLGFPMYLNDGLPDCTCAAAAHGTRVWTHNVGTPIDPTDDQVLAMFDATGQRNDGRVMLDILNFWRQFGLDGHRIGAFVQIDPKNRREVEAAVWLFGGLYVGLDLPVSAQHQKKWTVKPGADGEPGSWGGHAVWVPDFDKMRGPTAITWGERVTMSWGFWRKYVDEAYAVLGPEWLDGTQKAPSGFDLKTLTDDLSQFTAPQ